MTNIEISKLANGTKVRIKKSVEAAECYKKTCLLSWYDHKKQGRTSINTDTGELEISYPFGVETPSGVCYLFPAECYELV